MMMRTITKVIGMTIAASTAVLTASVAQASGEVNVYSYRQEALIRPLLKAFTEDTGITVNLVSGKADALLERLKNEGMNSPADVLLTVDVGRLERAKRADLLQPVTSDTLTKLVPEQYRDEDNTWYALSLRSRVVMYSPERVKEGELDTYEGLADPKWKGRICIRSSSNIYNQSLVSALIEHNGEAKTLEWAKGLVSNMARKPQGSDRDQVRAVFAGQCDVAIANTYYLGQLAKGKKDFDRQTAAYVKVFWPNQNGRGTHINVSGAGVTKSAKNVDNAKKFIEFLASDKAQAIYADVVNEYPIRDNIKLSELVASWGKFKADDIKLSTFADNNRRAVEIMDEAGWR